ncbi:unnamed protein product, partial [Tilletia caries]
MSLSNSFPTVQASLAMMDVAIRFSNQVQAMDQAIQASVKRMPALCNPLSAINLRLEEQDLFREEIHKINFKVYNIDQLKRIYDTAAYQLPRWSVDLSKKFSAIVQQVGYFRITGTWLPLPSVVPVPYPSEPTYSPEENLTMSTDSDVSVQVAMLEVARSFTRQVQALDRAARTSAQHMP